MVPSNRSIETTSSSPLSSTRITSSRAEMTRIPNAPPYSRVADRLFRRFELSHAGSLPDGAAFAFRLTHVRRLLTGHRFTRYQLCSEPDTRKPGSQTTKTSNATSISSISSFSSPSALETTDAGDARRMRILCSVVGGLCRTANCNRSPDCALTQAQSLVGRRTASITRSGDLALGGPGRRVVPWPSRYESRWSMTT